MSISLGWDVILWSYPLRQCQPHILMHFLSISMNLNSLCLQRGICACGDIRFVPIFLPFCTPFSLALFLFACFFFLTYLNIATQMTKRCARNLKLEKQLAVQATARRRNLETTHHPLFCTIPGGTCRALPNSQHQTVI